MGLSGIIVPLVTPLNDDESVNVDLLQKHLGWVLEAGVHGVLVGGSMGEYPALDEQEKRRALEAVCRIAEGKTVIVANISDTSEKRVIRYIATIKDFPVDAYILTSPYYFLHTWSELSAFFWQIADMAEKPLLLYNIPEFVGNRLSADLVISLAQHPYVVGLKDSSGDFSNFTSILLRKPDGFSVFQGCTELSLPSLLLGCEGIISGLSNIIPAKFVRLFSLLKENNTEKAKELQREIKEINGVFAKHGFLVAVKYGLSVLGLSTARATRPFVEVSAEGKQEIEKVLKTYAVL